MFAQRHRKCSLGHSNQDCSSTMPTRASKLPTHWFSTGCCSNGTDINCYTFTCRPIFLSEDMKHVCTGTKSTDFTNSCTTSDTCSMNEIMSQIMTYSNQTSKAANLKPMPCILWSR